MRVLVIGLRGIPGIQGGIETHAEHLYPLLVTLGCQVEVLVRPAFYPNGVPKDWRGVKLRGVWCPNITGLEAFAHTFLGVLYAGVIRPDVLHVHAVGPGLMIPLARLLRLQVVFTHHGPDYNREKWGKVSRWALRTGERWAVSFSHQSIAVSEWIRKLVQKKYEKDILAIPNGVSIPKIRDTTVTLENLNLVQHQYILQVARFVPEKRQLDLIKAFRRAKMSGWKLVFVGEVDKKTQYGQDVTSEINDDPAIVLAGFQSGIPLSELYSHAGMFVLPSSHEGLPIVLLEALSYGLPALASDIPANREIGLAQDCYFPVGNISALCHLLRDIETPGFPIHNRDHIRRFVKKNYDWNFIAQRTLEAYSDLV